MALEAAHRGYEYQDLLAAARLVDVILGSVSEIHVDEKLFPDDRFDDLTTVDLAGHRERIQIKYTDNDNRALTLGTFTNDQRDLRLDHLIVSALTDRAGPGENATELRFRIVLRDTTPVDETLLAILRPATPDPGPILEGLGTVRMRFDADAIWERSWGATLDPPEPDSFGFLKEMEPSIQRSDLEWVCDRIVVEVGAASASLDLIAPGPGERLLLGRVQNEIGAGLYPNGERSAVDVAEALIRSARAARQGTFSVTAQELLRRAQLRNDFGAVARRHPVDKSIEVSRAGAVDELVQQASHAAEHGTAILLVGPPGQGKSWISHQLIETLSAKNWIVSEHYCYLGDADGERLPRVLTESVFGSLLARIAEHDSNLTSRHRPMLAADDEALEDALATAIREQPDRRVALVVDGIDHVTRVVPGGPSSNPSLALAEAFAGLNVPKGCVLVVLSQPGNHLEPLMAKGAVTLPVPSLTENELSQLATRLGVIPGDSGGASTDVSLVDGEEASAEFVAALQERSKGNALYATYLCRETLRDPSTAIDPSAIVRGMPEFDGTLLNYYRHIQSSLGDQGSWVADVIALIDFPVTRVELREIMPEMAHRVDGALEVLRPVLVELATQGGVRVYHESFARFLRHPFQEDATARTALFDKVIDWLEGKGMFEDSRAYRYLLRILAEAGYNQRVVDAVDGNYAVRSIAAGFPASAIGINLITAVGSAARIADWPALVRCVELSRAVETYQDERFEYLVVDYIDVVGALLGIESVAERMLHNGRPTMAARAGLQLCSAVDRHGAVPPWREYMTAHLRESEDDNTHYGEESENAVRLAWLCGRLRLASHQFGAASHDPAGSSSPDPQGPKRPQDPDVSGPMNWERLATILEQGNLAADDVVAAILMTFGLEEVVELLGRLGEPGAACLALAEEIAHGRAPTSQGGPRDWAARAAKVGVPPGAVSRLFALGLEVSDLAIEGVESSRERLFELTREIQRQGIQWESGSLGEWMDACAIAARRDAIGLGAAEAMLSQPGWYVCWLRFLVALAHAEAASQDEQSQLSLDAIRILAEVKDPFLGEPRACDLYSIHGLIDETIRRAVAILDDAAWSEGLEILDGVSSAISVTLRGEMGGPLPRDRLLRIAVDTATTTRQEAARQLVARELTEGGGGRYYSDLAEYRLLAARLAIKADNVGEAQDHWVDACRLLTAYGWHKDITLFELIDPLPALIASDPARGRVRVAQLQPLCERIPQHTDGKETRHAWSSWWELLANADPSALAELAQARLLGSCNRPNYLLHEARLELWRAWHDRADPVAAGALRLTLEEPLEETDPRAFELVVSKLEEAGRANQRDIVVALLARFDERPFKYSYSNSDELLARDWKRIHRVNEIAAGANLPRVSQVGAYKGAESTPGTRKQGGVLGNRRHQGPDCFPSGALGMARAIRAWVSRSYDEEGPGWAPDRFASVIGYRMIELLEGGRESEVSSTLRLIKTRGLSDTGPLLAALAEGFERYGHSRLAAEAYALAWTRARGRGWLSLGGETAIEFLQDGARIDRDTVLSVIAEDIESIMARGVGTLGITQALVRSFATTDLVDSSVSTAFGIWDAARAVIEDRAPRVDPTDDPEDPYEPPDPDHGEALVGDIDTAFAAAALAGLAHSGREQKRRSIAAIQVLLSERPGIIAEPLSSGLCQLSDPATLSWLLRVIELAGESADHIVQVCREALVELARRPHLTVRAVARRLLGDEGIPLSPPSDPDPELLVQERIVMPDDSEQENEGNEDEIVAHVAGRRLTKAERIAPGLVQASIRRFAAARKTEEYERLIKAQLDAYGDQTTKRWPDAFMAGEEAVEDAIQRAAAGVRAARMLNGEAVSDPVDLEDAIARALLNDPALPLGLEWTRHPRPGVDPPPPRGHPLWGALHSRAEGASVSETGVLEAGIRTEMVVGTVAIQDPLMSPLVRGGKYHAWRVVATLERRAIAPKEWRAENNDIAQRYKVIEVRPEGDSAALTLPPVASGDVRAWQVPGPDALPKGWNSSRKPLVGIDADVVAAGDAHYGLGIQTPLLNPTGWLLAALGLRPGAGFACEDEEGPALALITWRTEYEVSDYHLTWPRLCGAGLVVRQDAFDRLIDVGNGELRLRDYLAGSTALGE